MNDWSVVADEAGSVEIEGWAPGGVLGEVVSTSRCRCFGEVFINWPDRSTVPNLLTALVLSATDGARACFERELVLLGASAND